MKKLVVVLLATAAFASSPAAAANLLADGSFEGGFGAWTLGGTSGDGFPPVVIPYNSSAGYPGGAFGEPIPNDNAAGNPGLDPVGDSAAYFVADLARPQTLTQSVTIVAGTSYTFGFDAYVPGNGAANPNDATLTATVGGLQFASFAASGSPVQQWLHFSSAATAGISGTVDFVFTYNSFGVPAKDFVIDRVYFAPTASVPEPATWAMMIGGLGFVGALSRRRKVTIAYA